MLVLYANLRSRIGWKVHPILSPGQSGAGTIHASGGTRFRRVTPALVGRVAMRTAVLITTFFGVMLAAHVQAEPITPDVVGGMPTWRWSADGVPATALRIDLVRADVTVVASRNRNISVTISAEGSPEEAARVWIDVLRQDGGYVVSDRFPRRPPWAFLPECLPPPDERGDFWLVATRLKVVVSVPSGMQPIVVLKDGTTKNAR